MTKDFNVFLMLLQKSQTASSRGIHNIIPEHLLDNAKKLFEVYTALSSYFESYGTYLCITSGYRCPALNKAVGGVSNSYHLKCLAFDFVLDDFDGTFVTSFDYWSNCVRKFVKRNIPNAKVICYSNKHFIHLQIK